MEKSSEKIILQTAKKHFIQKGLAGARMQEIADEAGINKALLHYYFRTKNKLYEEITIQIFNKIIPKIAEAMNTSGDIWDKIDGIVNTYITILTEDSEAPLFIMYELSQNREHFVAHLKKQSNFFPAVQNFIMVLQQEMDSGQMKPYPPFQLLLSVLGMTIFPFMAKPVFSTILKVPDESFNEIMSERKDFIMDFLRQALIPIKK